MTEYELVQSWFSGIEAYDSGFEFWITGTYAVIVAGGQETVYTSIAKMKMRALTDSQILRYIDIDEPLHSCGSYRLEALGISLFESINCDDYTSIIGIPLMWTSQTLSKLGVSVP